MRICIKEIRLENNISQQELADRMGISAPITHLSQH